MIPFYGIQIKPPGLLLDVGTFATADQTINNTASVFQNHKQHAVKSHAFR